MKIEFRVIICLMIFSFLPVSAQDDIINRYNESGLMTGKWVKYYDNGKIRYEGNFIDGRPVGLLKRYFSGGILQAEIFFRPGGDTSYACLYYENGDIAAVGKYISEKRDSTWLFYSFYNKRIALREDYFYGFKNGISEKYFDNEVVSERILWRNNVKDGKWEQFYENGNRRLVAYHKNDLRHGPFESFTSSGDTSIIGYYSEGLMHGNWIYFKEGGRDFTLEYNSGVMLPNSEYEKRIDEFSRRLDESIGLYPEVDTEGGN